MPCGVSDCHKTFFSFFLLQSFSHCLSLFFHIRLSMSTLSVSIWLSVCYFFIFSVSLHFVFSVFVSSNFKVCVLSNSLNAAVILSVCLFVYILTCILFHPVLDRPEKRLNDLSRLKFIVSNFHEDVQGIHYLTYPKFKIGNCREHAVLNALLIAVCW